MRAEQGVATVGDPWWRRRIGWVWLSGAIVVVGLVILLPQWEGLDSASAHHPDVAPASRLVTHAQRAFRGLTKTVALPEWLRAPADAGLLHARYAFDVDLPAGAHEQALFFPGLRAHSRIAINGRIIYDTLEHAEESVPRAAGASLFLLLPDELLRPGSNAVSVEVAGRRRLSVSKVQFGSAATLQRLHDRKVMFTVIGPALAATVVGATAVVVLLLWARLRSRDEYAYFGFGALVWALHSGWSLLPSPLLDAPHYDVWWTWVYSFFVAMLVIFCVRLAEWRWPRFEKALWLILALGVPLLYGASATSWFESAQQYWRLGCVAAAAVGAIAVARYAWRRRNVESLLLTIVGAACTAFAVRDWGVDRANQDNNPVWLVPYGGLLFMMLVGWMLIDRFIATAQGLEALNADLEERVADKSAELVSALEAMRSARDAAEAANRAKSAFFAAASHDLRQPIHALGLYMSALQADGLPTRKRDLVHRMDGSLAALAAMFNTLLDMSRMDAGAMVPAPRPIAVSTLLHRLGAEFAADAAAKGLRLSVRISSAATRLNAWSDPLLLECILRNLIGNAIKYTARGGVLVSCRTRARVGEPPLMCFEVWDTGLGIAADEQQRVFEEFYQVGNPERDRMGGLGLGLSIVRRLSKLLGHQVELASTPTRGSRFRVSAQSTDATVAEPVEVLSVGSLDGLRVAVIEDDPEVRDGMREMLGAWGCIVTDGTDGASVIASAGIPTLVNAWPDAVIADFRLRNGRNGVQETERVRAAFGRSIPALLISGDWAPERLAEMRASGLELLSKPVSAARVRSWLLSLRPRAAVEAVEKATP